MAVKEEKPVVETKDKKPAQEVKGPRPIDPERHREFLMAMKPQGMIDAMRDMVIAMAGRIHENDPAADTSKITVRAFMLGD